MTSSRDFAVLDAQLQSMREREYPALKNSLYLDHAGTTLFSKSLVDDFATSMTASLTGNPHSASSSSQASTRLVDDVRFQALRYFNADPDQFDLVFVANATAGLKLVAECLEATPSGFWLGYHLDCHTSVVGMRELAAAGSHCFTSDKDVSVWIRGDASKDAHAALELFAYPAQSNMNGRRLPLEWCSLVSQSSPSGRRYTLLDAAAFVSTSPLDLGDAKAAPDFTVLSFYKMFGFPDLGALIVKRSAAPLLSRRRYFGGGTVDMVVAAKEQWHVSKSGAIHESLEDGTLPFHNIMALGCALSVQNRLFPSLKNISNHILQLSKYLYESLRDLQHGNKAKVCEIYKSPTSEYGDYLTQGPIVAFNLNTGDGAWVSNYEVEKAASIRDVHMRSGGMCNPGGVASALDLAPWELRENFSAGHRCGNENDIVNGKPTGVLRVSLGLMSTKNDVDRFMAFIREFFVDDVAAEQATDQGLESYEQGQFFVESLMIYPIKSCAAWPIPTGKSWNVHPEGLEWDREWCLVHEGTGNTLSQKRYPKMALLQPSIDLERGFLHVRFCGGSADKTDCIDEISIPLSGNPTPFRGESTQLRPSQVCGDQIEAKFYASTEYSRFFSTCLGVPCQLARFPAGGNGQSARHAKAGLSSMLKTDIGIRPSRQPILLSNESPILLISRSSLNRLNEQIKAKGGKAARAAVFRPNIVVAQRLELAPGTEQPYAEDHWSAIQVGEQYFQMLGLCRRCQMVCVDQRTAEKNEEPFVTLAKTRRFEGKVWFGQHTCHIPSRTAAGPARQRPTIKTGDAVRVVDEVQAHDLLRST